MPLRWDAVPKPGILYSMSREAPRERRTLYRTIFCLLLACLYGAGCGTGAFIMWRHHHADDVVAAVNGAPLSAADLYGRLEQQAGPRTLSDMASQELTLQYAREKHLLPTNMAIADRAEQLMRDDPQTAGSLLIRRPSVAQLSRARAQLITEALYGRDVSVTDADARSYYREQISPGRADARFYHPETIKLAVIVTPSQRDVRRAWTEILHGSAFGTEAHRYSKDRSAVSGGELSAFARGRSALHRFPAVESVIFKLQVGSLLPPTNFGGVWWIARCLGRTPSSVTPFEDVKTVCVEGARMRKGAATNAKQVKDDIETFRRQAKIQVFWDRYDKVAASWTSGTE